VFAYMQDFEVNDDISMHIEPAVQPMQFATTAGPAQGMSVGMSVGLKF